MGGQGGLGCPALHPWGDITSAADAWSFPCRSSPGSVSTWVGSCLLQGHDAGGREISEVPGWSQSGGPGPRSSGKGVGMKACRWQVHRAQRGCQGVASRSDRPDGMAAAWDKKVV